MRKEYNKESLLIGKEKDTFLEGVYIFLDRGYSIENAVNDAIIAMNLAKLGKD